MSPRSFTSAILRTALGVSLEFSEFNVDPRLFKAVQKMGFERPTPIQASAIPPALTGQDIWGSAETGTGKTAAFLLPLMHRLLEGTAPQALNNTANEATITKKITRLNFIKSPDLLPRRIARL